MAGGVESAMTCKQDELVLVVLEHRDGVAFEHVQVELVGDHPELSHRVAGLLGELLQVFLDGVLLLGGQGCGKAKDEE